MTIDEMRAAIAHKLAPHVGEGEAKAMARIILEEVKGYTTAEMFMFGKRELLPETETRIDKIVEKIISGMPMQYALGRAQFHGRNFAVNPSVLIPRQETSQLVDIILDNNRGRNDLTVLDIGSGSGCIAVTLALDLKFADVTAVDISNDALQTTFDNAKNLGARVSVTPGDAFNLAESRAGRKNYDIIVSNPPYVLESEKSTIDPLVKDYEPALALFVDDDKKVEIYRAIIGFAAKHLNDGGQLYLEINPLCATYFLQMIKDAGLRDGEILLDYRGKKRFAYARK